MAFSQIHFADNNARNRALLSKDTIKSTIFAYLPSYDLLRLRSASSSFDTYIKFNCCRPIMRDESKELHFSRTYKLRGVGFVIHSMPDAIFQLFDYFRIWIDIRDPDACRFVCDFADYLQSRVGDDLRNDIKHPCVALNCAPGEIFVQATYMQ